MVTEKKNKLVDAIVEGMLEKKANDVVSLDLTKIPNAVCSYFIICDADSTTHVGTIADFVEANTKQKLKERVWMKEGQANAEWVLLDYGNVVVHIFQREQRKFYNIEALWADAKIKSYTESN